MQGKGIQIDAKELNIESLQDTATYKSKQQNIEGQATIGFGGASVSGSASKSNINANYASVNEQSGVFAGDDGYQINVKNNTDLKGAIITSTQTAENLGKNSLDTGTLTASDIHNVSEYDAKGIGISAGFNAGKAEEKGKDGERQPDTVLSSPDKIDEHASSQIGTSKSVGFGLDSDKDSSTTHSGINTQNINIRDEQAQQQLTGKTAEQTKKDILTQVTTDTARENSGAIANNFDKDKVLSEINLQVNVTKEFRENSLSLVDEYASHKQAELRDKIKQATSEDEKTAIYEEIYKVQYQRGFLETLVGIVTLNPDVAITQGTLQLAATKMRENTLANSRLFPPIIDEKTGMELSNVSYDSGYFDGVKLGGVRLDLDAICGINDERCTQSGNGSYAYVGDSNFPTLADAINPEKNVKAKEMYGATGGLQAIQGSMFGSYLPGGWKDMAVESFAGTHDYSGGQIWGWYDRLGNTSRGRDKPGNHDGILSTVTTIVAIPVSAPFALADLISPDVIQLIFNIAGR